MAPQPQRGLVLSIFFLFNLRPSSHGRQRDLSKVMPDRVSSLLIIPPILPHFSFCVPPRVLLCKSSSMPTSPGSPLYPLLLQHSWVHTQTHACIHTYIYPHTFMGYCSVKPNHVCSCCLNFSCLWALVQGTASAWNILFFSSESWFLPDLSLMSHPLGGLCKPPRRTFLMFPQHPWLLASQFSEHCLIAACHFSAPLVCRLFDSRACVELLTGVCSVPNLLIEWIC